MHRLPRPLDDGDHHLFQLRHVGAHPVGFTGDPQLESHVGSEQRAQSRTKSRQGGFEIRTFISVAAAAQGKGHLHFYRPIPIFAVGCTVATMSIDNAMTTGT